LYGPSTPSAVTLFTIRVPDTLVGGVSGGASTGPILSTNALRISSEKLDVVLLARLEGELPS